MTYANRLRAGVLVLLVAMVATSGRAQAGEAAAAEISASTAQALLALSGLGSGMWAYYVPKGLRGEFDSYDPIGLIAGDLIKADCSLSWKDAEGKVYCFASGASLVYFQDWPNSNLQKARAAWEKISATAPQF